MKSSKRKMGWKVAIARSFIKDLKMAPKPTQLAADKAIYNKKLIEASSLQNLRFLTILRWKVRRKSEKLLSYPYSRLADGHRIYPPKGNSDQNFKPEAQFTSTFLRGNKCFKFFNWAKSMSNSSRRKFLTAAAAIGGRLCRFAIYRQCRRRPKNTPGPSRVLHTEGPCFNSRQGQAGGRCKDAEEYPDGERAARGYPCRYWKSGM